MIGDKRDTVAVTTTEDIDFNADGGAVLVSVSGNGSIDFQTTANGVTYLNIPYIDRTSLYPEPSIDTVVAQVATKLYLILGPLSQVRIACTGVLTISWRTIQGGNILPSSNPLNAALDSVMVSMSGDSRPVGLVELLTVLEALLVELRRISRIGELTLGQEVAR